MTKKKPVLDAVEKMAQGMGLLEVIECPKAVKDLAENIRKELAPLQKQRDDLTKQLNELDEQADKVRSRFWKDLNKIMPETKKLEHAHYDIEHNVLKIMKEPKGIKEVVKTLKKKGKK